VAKRRKIRFEDACRGKKYCSGCGQWLAIQMFDRNEHRVDRLHTWCHACLAGFENVRPSRRKARITAYQEARHRAYFLWFRQTKGDLLLDKRWAARTECPTIKLMHSHRRQLITLRASADYAVDLRAMLVGAFRCDPADVRVRGIGGGSGARLQPQGVVEGGATYAAWTQGLAEISNNGWAIFRVNYEDVVAVNQ